MHFDADLPLVNSAKQTRKGENRRGRGVFPELAEINDSRGFLAHYRGFAETVSLRHSETLYLFSLNHTHQTLRWMKILGYLINRLASKRGSAYYRLCSVLIREKH
jgi:hypothetical protein